jgi:hypothetical protein
MEKPAYYYIRAFYIETLAKSCAGVSIRAVRAEALIDIEEEYPEWTEAVKVRIHEISESIRPIQGEMYQVLYPNKYNSWHQWELN